MGDPKFSKRKYESPAQPWEGERIKAENELLQKYGLKNKRELWTAQSLVRRLRAQSRELQARLRTGDPQAKKETEELLGRCGRLALLPADGATLNDVRRGEEEAIDYHETSPLTDDMHPTRPKPEELERKRASDKAKAEAKAMRANERSRGPPKRMPRKPRPVREAAPSNDTASKPEEKKPDAENSEK
jgi:ribosomal protein S4